MTIGVARRVKDAIGPVRGPRKSNLKLSTVLLLSYHFYPSHEIGARRVTALARHLAARGVRVLVVSAFGDQSIQADNELLPGIFAIPVRRPNRYLLDSLVALKRIRTSGRKRAVEARSDGSPTANHESSFWRRVRERYFRAIYFVDEYKTWAWRASRAAIRAGRREKLSLIFVSGPPHSALLAAARAARVLKVPYVADLRDPWSDSLVSPERKLALHALRFLEKRTLRRAAAVTSTGATVADLLVDRDVSLKRRTFVVRNGFDGPVAVGGSATQGRLTILFAGELYVGRDPFPFLSALDSLLACPDVDATRINVIFMGKVASYAGRSLGDWLAGRLSESVVKIFPPQPPEVVADAVSTSTVLLNLAQRQHLSVPAKTYEHLASGREILLLCEDDCETARLVSGIRGVNQVDPAKPGALADALLDLYRRHVVQGTMTAPSELDAAAFSREAANAALVDIFESVARERN